MKNFLELLKERIVFFDGAQGTELQKKNVSFKCPEELNLTRPDIVKSILKSYAGAGSDLINTFTFGANQLKLSDYGLEKKTREINIAAVKIARSAVGRNRYVAGDVGPIGKYLEPLDKLSFDEAYDVFSEQIIGLRDAGADVLMLETMTDIREMKAAITAAKQNTMLPVIASMTFEGERTGTGTDPKTFAAIAESLGADIIGVNCSLGPDGLFPVVKEICNSTHLPVMVKPNAGVPRVVNGNTVFDATPKYMVEYAVKFYKLGVNLIGGCCGTTPEHIRTIVKALKGKKPVPRRVKPVTRFCSRTKTVALTGYPVVVGERINPSGRKELADEIKRGVSNIIRKEALNQQSKGASLLDINVGLPGIDESKTLRTAMIAIQGASDLPIVIDTSDKKALEEALKISDGKPLINSVNGKKSSLDSILPLAKKYGAGVIGLCLDEKGVPKTADEKVRIAKKILKAAEKTGMRKEDVVIDCLTMALSTDKNSANETLKALKQVKKLGIKTLLGISNISYGLPNRTQVNSAFLSMALKAGLDMAIINPTDKAVMNTFKSSSSATGKDINFSEYIKLQTVQRKKRRGQAITSIDNMLYYAIIDGSEDSIIPLVEDALKKGYAALKINEILISALNEVGRKFNKKEFFLPNVLLSASAMRKAFERLKKELKKEKSKSHGRILFATVKDDVHDIGKNIVIALLESRNYEVIDLGKDVDAKKIIQAAMKQKPNLICLSALMTTTVVNMPLVIKELKKQGLKIPVMVGGAVVTESYAKSIGAFYSPDALKAIDAVKMSLKTLKK